MLKKFFLRLLSSFIGARLAIILSGVVIVAVIVALSGKFITTETKDALVKVQNNSVLLLDLKGNIAENNTSININAAMLLAPDIEEPQLLRHLLSALDKAAEDPRISAVYVKCGELQVAPATARQLQQALAEYKRKSKRPVIAYADNMQQSCMYIAACADSVFLNPQGALMLTGCGSTSLYFKELFDKIGVQWQVAKVGTYKSAVEPFSTDEMSEPARRQLMELYSEVWKGIRKGIAQGRGVSETVIDSLTNAVCMTLPARDLVKTGIISSTAYERQMDEKIARVAGVDTDDLHYINANDFGAENIFNSGNTQHIAVLYACGEIQERTDIGIDCYKLVPIITKLADDDNVSGMVLRVNSPGGSVFGSEQISEALAYFQSKGKPLVVSMGDYAASGGYWISCGADRIFADPYTITGSIGIFGLVPDCSPLLNNIGIAPQTVTTNPNALIAPPFLPFNDAQMAALQRAIEKGYDQFLTKVSNGRHMNKAAVDSIAQGRVWIGEQAVKLGLADQTGSLQTALKYVAEKTDTDIKNVAYYPSVETDFRSMLLKAVGNTATSQMLGKAIGNYPTASPLLLRYLSDILQRNRQQALLPSAYLFSAL